MNILKNTISLFYIINMHLYEFIKNKIVHPIKRYLIYDYISELSEIIMEPEMINIYHTGYKLLLSDNVIKLFNVYFDVINNIDAKLLKINISTNIKNILLQIGLELHMLSCDSVRSHSHLKDTLLPQLFEEILNILKSDNDFIEHISEYFIEAVILLKHNKDLDPFILEIYKILQNKNNSIKKLRKLLNIDEIILIKIIKYLKD